MSAIARTLLRCLVACCCTMAAPILAAPPTEEADGLAETARKLAENRDFSRAAELYRRAFALTADSRFAWNAARVLEFGGDLAEAHLWYVRAHATATSSDKKAKVIEALAAAEAKLLRGRLARLIVSSTPIQARVHVDGVEIPLLDQDHVRWLSTGGHALVVDAPAHQTQTSTVLMVAGIGQRLALVLRPLANVGPSRLNASLLTASSVEPTAPIANWAAVAAAVAGAAGLGLGAWWLNDGAIAKAAANAEPIGNQTDIARYKAAASTANGT